MTSVVAITSFGAQTLADSTNYKQLRTFDSGGTALNSFYTDIDGNIFDADGSGANTIIPGSVEVELFVRETTAANFVTKTNAVIALGGTTATLTGTTASGTTKTCTARCAPVERVMGLDTFGSLVAHFTLRFSRKTEWA